MTATDVTGPEGVDRAELRRAGLALGGARGFSCVGCHQVGKFEPRGVAIASRGSDCIELTSGCARFFARWVRSPLRIVPNMEMPSFERPAPGVLHERMDWQLAALWNVLSDPQQPPAFDTSTVEQFLAAVPGQSPAIVAQRVQHWYVAAIESGAAEFRGGIRQPGQPAVRSRPDGAACLVERAVRGRGLRARAGTGSRREPICAIFRLKGQTCCLTTGNSRPWSLNPEAGRFGRLISYRSTPGTVELSYSLRFLIGNDSTTLNVARSLLGHAIDRGRGVSPGMAAFDSGDRRPPDRRVLVTQTTSRCTSASGEHTAPRCGQAEKAASIDLTYHIAVPVRYPAGRFRGRESNPGTEQRVGALHSPEARCSRSTLCPAITAFGFPCPLRSCPRRSRGEPMELWRSAH